jgi:hypothetical protein
MDARSGTGKPIHDEVHAALNRVIASEALRGSPQLIAFLGFVVEATLRGEGHLIKAYTIGVEALGRGKDFDPNTDPIVRVEAGRLRRALERYYAGVGETDPILIHIPRGHYVAEFRYRQIAIATRRRSFVELMLAWLPWPSNF